MRKEASIYPDIFKTHIEILTGSTLNSCTRLLEICELRYIKKNQVFLKEGQVYKKEIFLAEGVFRVYLQDNSGENINISFYSSPQVVAPYFTRNITDEHLINFQAITDCILLVFDAQKFNNLIRKYYDIREFAYNVLEKELKFKARKEKCFVSRPASDRLQFFRDSYPGLENKIPQHHIASFIGIPPASLSRLRRKPH